MSGTRLTRARAIAHRGDPVAHPENTLAGIASALRAGADQVEIDVKLTADGEVVLLHDDTLERIWGLDVAVTEVIRADLDPGVRARGALPTLAEALALVGGTGTSLLVDLDAVAWAEPALTVVQATVAAGGGGAARGRLVRTTRLVAGGQSGRPRRPDRVVVGRGQRRR